MSNSFYYFFSAAPQVLGGVLALFGVFVVFKIQTIKAGLLSISEMIIDSLKKLLPQTGYKSDEDIIKLRRQLLRDLTMSHQSQDIKELHKFITGADQNGFYSLESLRPLLNNFTQKYKFLQDLISQTVTSSIITATVIVISLTILPLGHILVDNKVVTYLLFALIIIGILFSFLRLIKVLKRALMDV